MYYSLLNDGEKPKPCFQAMEEVSIIYIRAHSWRMSKHCKDTEEETSLTCLRKSTSTETAKSGQRVWQGYNFFLNIVDAGIVSHPRFMKLILQMADGCKSVEIIPKQMLLSKLSFLVTCMSSLNSECHQVAHRESIGKAVRVPVIIINVGIHVIG